MREELLKGLTEEQLEAVSGGMCHTDEKPAKCPECGSKDLEFSGDPFSPTGIYICKKCGNRFAREVPRAPWA